MIGKAKKRILAMFMAVCMILTMMPSTAFASIGVPAAEPTSTGITGATLVKSIKVGENEINNFSKIENKIDEKDIIFRGSDLEHVIESEEIKTTNIEITPADGKTIAVNYEVGDNITESAKHFSTNLGNSSEGSAEAIKGQIASGLNETAKTVYFQVEDKAVEGTKEYYRLTLNIKKAAAELTVTTSALNPGEENTVYLNVKASGVEQSYQYKLLEEDNTKGSAFYKDDVFSLSGYTPAKKEDIEASNKLTVTKATEEKYIEVYGLGEEKKVVSYGKTQIAADNYVPEPKFKEYDSYSTDKVDNKIFPLTLEDKAENTEYKVYDAQTGGSKNGEITAEEEDGKLTLTLTTGLSSPSAKVYIAAVKDGHESKRVEVTLHKYQNLTDSAITKIEEVSNPETPMFKEMNPGIGGATVGTAKTVSLEVPYDVNGKEPKIKLTLSKGATATYFIGDAEQPSDIITSVDGNIQPTIKKGGTVTVYVKVTAEDGVNFGYYKLVISMADPSPVADIETITVTSTVDTVGQEVAVNNEKGDKFENIEELECTIPYKKDGDTATVKITTENSGAVITTADDDPEDADGINTVYDPEAGVEVKNIKYDKDNNVGETVYVKVVSQDGKNMRLVKLTIKMAAPKKDVGITGLTVAGFEGKEKAATGDGTTAAKPIEYTVAVPNDKFDDLKSSANVKVAVAYSTISAVEANIEDNTAEPLTADETKLIYSGTVTADSTPSEVILIKVTAQDGETSKYYKVTLEQSIVVEDPMAPKIDCGIYSELENTLTENGIEAKGGIKGFDFTEITQNVIDTPAYGKEAATAALEKKGIEVFGGVFVHVIPMLDIRVDSYNYTKGFEKLVLDVDPYYVIKAAIVDKGTLTASNSVVMGSERREFEELSEIIGEDGVTVNLPIESNFAGDGEKLYVRLDNEKFVQECTVASSAIAINFPHFSKVTITKNHGEASMEVEGEKLYYDTLQDAVDAIPEDQDPEKAVEITLYSKPDEAAKVNRPLTIKLTADAEEYTDAAKDLKELKEILVASGNVELVSTTEKPNPSGTNMTDGLTFTFTAIKPVNPDPSNPSDTPDPDNPDPDDSTTGELTVSKKVVTDDDVDKDKEFTFTVTVTADPAVNGSYSGMTFTNGVATITLKDGQSKTAIGLPAGATYKVEETAVEGFTSSATGATGTIGSIASTAAFTNTKDGVTPTPTPTVEPSENGKLVFTDDRQPKALLDRSTTDKDCSLKLAADDGDELTSIEVKSSDPKVVKVVDGKLRYMDLGTADITVTATGKSGKTYIITFPVKVTKIGRPTLTVSNKISKKAKTFTVTTSTVRGADGFIVKYSLKKNMSNSGKKKYACGKKLKRQPITVKKGKTTYYVKVRAYKKVDGKIKKYAWSKETEKIKSR